jgi:hypothetical protein
MREPLATARRGTNSVAATHATEKYVPPPPGFITQEKVIVRVIGPDGQVKEQCEVITYQHPRVDIKEEQYDR